MSTSRAELQLSLYFQFSFTGCQKRMTSLMPKHWFVCLRVLTCLTQQWWLNQWCEIGVWLSVWLTNGKWGDVSLNDNGVLKSTHIWYPLTGWNHKLHMEKNSLKTASEITFVGSIHHQGCNYFAIFGGHSFWNETAIVWSQKLWNLHPSYNTPSYMKLWPKSADWVWL